MSKAVLVVDDEEGIRRLLTDVLTDRGYRVTAVGDGESAVSFVRSKGDADVIILDVRMPDISGLEVLEKLRGLESEAYVIMMTAYSTTERAIGAMKLGAFEYLVKPFDVSELVAVVDRAAHAKDVAVAANAPAGAVAEAARMSNDDANDVPGIATDGASGDSQDAEALIGQSPAMQALYKMIGRVAGSDATVLIRGETGTGKELVALTLHQNGPRAVGPFVKVNCAAIPDGLLESELFGYEKGAFTGAFQRKPGRFELANGGTLLLDEVAELSPALQAKLLRVLQEKEFERVGGTTTIQTDARILASTNVELERAVSEGRFREDLFYRLNVVTIHLPPLRDRREDIPILAEYFFARAKNGVGRGYTGFSPEAMALLTRYHWPGNVRELANVVERAVILSGGYLVMPEHLPADVRLHGQPRGPVAPVPEANGYGSWVERGEAASCKPLKEIVADVERRTILAALEKADWHRGRAAAMLGLNRRSLYSKMKEYGIGSF